MGTLTSRAGPDCAALASFTPFTDFELPDAFYQLLLLSVKDTTGEIRMSKAKVKTPVHLWIIGILALLWDAIGAFDYVATQMRLDFYMSEFTLEQLDYFYGFPAWMDAAWAIAVWSSLLGALALLLRKSWAVPLFGIAIVGMLLTSIHSFVLSNGAQIMGDFAVKFTVVIWIIAVFLFLYARAMANKGVLR
jgi:hypothetical protein